MIETGRPEIILTNSPDGIPNLQTMSNNLDDVRIMQAARADLTRFAPLYDRYFPRIYRYCLRRVESEEAAEDLTSIIFTRALKGVADYRDGSVAAWLFRIAHNAVVNHYRARHAQVSLEREEIDVPAEADELIEGMMQAEQHRIIRTLVKQLPDEQQELLALKISGGLTAEEIGAVLGKNAGAIRVELHRIIKRLRAQYAERGLA
jgi:RNA polymerase sigma-70 factor (ECF subfamily)